MKRGKQSERDIGFAQGIVYALARIIDMYDQPSMASEIFKESGLKRGDLKKVSEYDLSILRKEVRYLPKKGVE